MHTCHMQESQLRHVDRISIRQAQCYGSDCAIRQNLYCGLTKTIETRAPRLQRFVVSCALHSSCRPNKA